MRDEQKKSEILHAAREHFGAIGEIVHREEDAWGCFGSLLLMLKARNARI
jgi:hypothetical protein